jgi:adenylate kinase family enzyme
VPHTSTTRSADRVIEVGTSCSGKSTFARRLSTVLQCPSVELDLLYWGPNWQPKSEQEFRQLVVHAVEADRWVVEGNYRVVREILWPRATTIIWLNYGFLTIFWRAFRRTLRRTVSREALWHGNRESFTRSFLSRESILVLGCHNLSPSQT